MRFVLSTILIALLAGLFTYVLPWWLVVVAAFTIGSAARPRPAFLAGFLGVFLLWLVVGLIRDLPNDHILATRMAGVLPLGGQWWLFLVVSAVVGGLVGGFGAWTGAAFADARERRKRAASMAQSSQGLHDVAA